MKKSAYVLVNRGSPERPVWTVEKDGLYCYSSRRKALAESMLRLCRRDERAAAKKAAWPPI